MRQDPFNSGKAGNGYFTSYDSYTYGQNDKYENTYDNSFYSNNTIPFHDTWWW